jgi:hypothetical protein
MAKTIKFQGFASRPFETTEVDFRQLDDGRVVELVEDPADTTKTKLAVFASGNVYLADSVDYNGKLLVPTARTSHGLEHVTLPRTPRPYQSTEEVFYRTSNLIKMCISLPDIYLHVASAFVLNSWFVDRLQPPPYLLVTGLPQSGKTTFLEALRLLCRRPLLVSEITPAAAYDACSRFGCTLLIDENDWRADPNSRALRKQLRAGTSKSLLAKHLGKAQHAFGAKVLSCIELPDDAALKSRCIQIPMNEADRTDLKKPWDPQVLKAADGVRGQLLQFRLERFGSVSPRVISGMEKLRPRSRDLLSSLLAPLKGEEVLEQLLLAFFVGTHDPSTQDLLSPGQTAIAAALFEFIHLSPEAGYVQVATVADQANKILNDRGERFTVNPRKCSDILASLGFGYIERSNQGSLRCLDNETITKIHQLKRKHGQQWLTPAALKTQMAKCRFCQAEFSPMPTRER